MIFNILSGITIIILFICILRLKYEIMVKEFEIEELLKKIKNLKHED